MCCRLPPKSFTIKVAEKFQIYSVKITVNTLVSQKIDLFIFTHAAKQNSPMGFYYLPGRRELPISPEQHFLKIFFIGHKSW